MNLPLTPEQAKIVDELIAQGWPREAAELMVLESQDDIVEDGTPPPPDTDD